MNQSEQMAKFRYIVTGETDERKQLNEMHDQHDSLPNEDMNNAPDELEALMKKYGVVKEGNNSCNMTAEGKECPVHGLEECGSYMQEAKHIKEAFTFNDKKGRWEWDDGTSYRMDELTPAQKARIEKWKKDNPGKKPAKPPAETELNRYRSPGLMREAKAATVSQPDKVAQAIIRAIKKDYADQGFNWAKITDVGEFTDFMEQYHNEKFYDNYTKLNKSDATKVFKAVRTAIKSHFGKWSVRDDARGMLGEAAKNPNRIKTESGSATISKDGVSFNNSGYRQKFTWSEINKMNSGKEVKGFILDKDHPYADRYTNVYSNGDEEHHLPKSVKKPEAVNEAVHITVDGDEAQDLIARLTQLAGNAEQAANAALSAADTAQDATDTALDITDTALDATNTALGAAELALDEPTMHSDDQHYVCDDCGCELDACACDVDDDCCQVCYTDPCCCDENDMTVTTHGLVDSKELDELDYGHDTVSGKGEEVDVDSYMYKGPKLAQRLVKGVMGDNPIAEASMDRFVKLANDYAAFLAESDIPNEDGQASPLTAADRADFDQDPFAGEDVKDTGDMSPLSQIKRQDVMK